MENAFNKLSNNELLEYFLSVQTSKTTVANYRSTINIFNCWLMAVKGGKPFSVVTKMDMLDYNKHIVDRNLADTTRQRIYTTIRSFYSWIVDVAGIIAPTDNPSAGVFPELTPDAIGKIADRLLDIEEVDKILDVCYSHPRNYALMRLLVTTACRVHEITGLLWGDIKLVPRIKGTGKIPMAFVIRKGGARQGIPLRQDTYDALLRYKYSLDIEPEDTDPVFSVKYRGQIKEITTERVRHILHGLAADAGVNVKVTPHWFRHTCLTYLIANGASLKDVQLYAGHKHITTTEKYLHGLLEDIGELLPLKARETIEQHIIDIESIKKTNARQYDVLQKNVRTAC